MKKLVFGGFLLLSISFSEVQAQNGGGGSAPGATAGFNFLGGLPTIQQKNTKSKLEGTFYIEDKWNQGEVLLTNELVIEDYSLKYDLKYNMLEFKFGEDIKVCPANRVSNFNWRGSDSKLRRFVNCKDYNFNDNARLIGFFEVLYDQGGSTKLFAKTKLKIQEPTYNVALDVGDKNSKILKNDDHFLILDGTAYLFSKNKNENFMLFGDKADDLKKFMKSKKLKFSRKEDLIEAIQYFDSL